MAICNGSLGDFDVYLTATPIAGQYQLSIIPVSINSPGETISVAITNHNVTSYKILVDKVALSTQPIDFATLSESDLANYDVLHLGLYQPGVPFASQTETADAICLLPHFDLDPSPNENSLTAGPWQLLSSTDPNVGAISATRYLIFEFDYDYRIKIFPVVNQTRNDVPSIAGEWKIDALHKTISVKYDSGSLDGGSVFHYTLTATSLTLVDQVTGFIYQFSPQPLTPL